MTHLVIRFVSRNEFKLKEAAEILGKIGVNIAPLKLTIDELQTTDTEALVKDKTMKAFEQVGRPLFVEHTGLYLSHLNGLPGGLTQIFWDSLQADRFAKLFGQSEDTSVTARTIVGYTDAKQFYTFEGEISGNVAPEPRGSRDFQWDCVFIPEGCKETFAEMGDRKNEISMRKQALNHFSDFLAERQKA